MEAVEILNILKTDRSKGIHCLFLRYYKPLVAFASTFVDRAESEDVVQELFAKLWESNYLDNVSPDALSSYMFSSVRNICLVRKRKPSFVDIVDEFYDVAEDVAMDMDDDMVSKVLAQIDALPERTAQVLRCVLVKGMKYKDAEKEMNISINSVKTLLKHGMRSLREKIKINFFYFPFTHFPFV